MHIYAYQEGTKVNIKVIVSWYAFEYKAPSNSVGTNFLQPSLTLSICYYLVCLLLLPRSLFSVSIEKEIQRYQNVAQFKTTSQSSLHGPNNPSSLAVDDSLSTCARTDEEKGATWTVDLGQSFIVSHLHINTGLSARARLLFIVITSHRVD